jgi:hypothetical protein
MVLPVTVFVVSIGGLGKEKAVGDQPLAAMKATYKS